MMLLTHNFVGENFGAAQKHDGSPKVQTVTETRFVLVP